MALSFTVLFDKDKKFQFGGILYQMADFGFTNSKSVHLHKQIKDEAFHSILLVIAAFLQGDFLSFMYKYVQVY